MKYRIISVGKIREPFFLDGINEYLKRLRPYTSIELVDGLEEKTNPKASEKEIQRVLDKEGERVLALVSPDELLVALDSQGRQLSSEQFAAYIDKWNASGLARVNLVVGGSHGLSPAVKERADFILSFSPMTFLHQMAVLILTEQIYRAFKIIRGEPYHK
ncbi:MAG TPA: 23S rRNA (pseudouridine(1915)-N(3))-methyltransferase RlmH [Syntrophomonadaceae bacterium]|nr:23S rRNA (pseudouridine(1915)-N(3))-methyltransferase RlmH [Syntrophomonadaceae bacterium]HOQ09387.1 23S rRNA (pseudouridine(1915)-N(3))-methyltransferase RlmH [Syntrophomonadaceae bacterium]HPU48257.1 23S rRNA (pseudouridine(1915)-N(3))-methyltransferase RlmH [Syntrophomonadaceae bacterium]